MGDVLMRASAFGVSRRFGLVPCDVALLTG